MVNPDFENNCVTENKPELKQQNFGIEISGFEKVALALTQILCTGNKLG